jgi:hypothetical protein
LKIFASQLRRRERWVQNSVSHRREGGGSGIGDVNKWGILFEAAPSSSNGDGQRRHQKCEGSGGGGSGIGDVDKWGILFEVAAAAMTTGGGGGVGDVNKWGILFEVAAAVMAAGSRAIKNGRAVAAAALETLISKVFCLRGQQ